MSDSTKIRVELQYTMNLGNYESLKINIGVEDFKRPDETIDAATERVYKFVEHKLEGKVNDEREALSKRR